MSNIHKLRCSCGQLSGELRLAGISNRCICYCTDCQAFARHLHARNVLDNQGGTDIIQVPPSNLDFTQGTENLACLRLTEKGMLRWYTTCCQTLIGNTPANRRISFVGLIHTCLSVEGQSLEASFGPVTMRVGVKTAVGQVKPAASGIFSGVAKAIALIVRGRIGSAYLKNPLFRSPAGDPIAIPTVLSASELAAAKSAA